MAAKKQQPGPDKEKIEALARDIFIELAAGGRYGGVATQAVLDAWYWAETFYGADDQAQLDPR